jgi:hypothetical protein
MFFTQSKDCLVNHFVQAGYLGCRNISDLEFLKYHSSLVCTLKGEEKLAVVTSLLGILKKDQNSLDRFLYFLTCLITFPKTFSSIVFLFRLFLKMKQTEEGKYMINTCAAFCST